MVDVKAVALQVWKEMHKEDPLRNHNSEWLTDFAERVVAAVDALRIVGKQTGMKR